MTKDVTDTSLFIRSSHDELVVWNNYKIVEELIRETNIDAEIAKEIADNIEDTIVHLNNNMTLTTALIRELVNNELIRRGMYVEYNKNIRIGLPMHDMEQLITSHNKENANIPHGPEATNLHIAETVKKEYALARVFTDDVANAHIKGDIHLHDLGFVDRVYTYMGDESIVVKDSTGLISCVSFRMLFNLCDVYYNEVENGVVIGLLNNYTVLDKDGWTPIKRVIRRIKTRQMYWIKTANSRSLVVTDNHPFLIKSTSGFDRVEAQYLQKGQEIHTIKGFVIDSEMDTINLTSKDLCTNNPNRIYYLDNVLIKDTEGLDKIINDLAVSTYKKLITEGFILDISNATIYSKSLNGNNKSKGLPVFFKLSKDFCYALGIIIAEGCYIDRGVCITTNKKYIDRVINVFRDLEMSFEIKDTNDTGCQCMRIYSTILNDLIYNYFSIGRGSKYVCLPDTTVSWKPELAYSLLCGIIDGDGSIKDHNILIRVASRQMLTQISWLLLAQGIKSCDRSCGGVGSVRVFKGVEIKQNYSIFGVSFYIPKGKNYLFDMSYKCIGIGNNLKDYSKSQDTIKTVKPIDIQDDFIYDITTESHTFMCNGIYSSNCSGNNVAYVAKYGLIVPNSPVVAKPAKRAEVLLEHVIKFSSALQGCLAGAVGWDAINTFFAPYLVGMTYEDMKHLAQMMLFEFNQQIAGRGGQALFSDINLYYEVPSHYRDVMAIGPGGIETGKTYGEYEKESQMFCKAIMETYLEGDGYGRPFFWPKADFHITEQFFKTQGHEEFLELLCEVAVEKGNTYFIFDRHDEVKLSECCFHPTQQALIKSGHGITKADIGSICRGYHKDGVEVFHNGVFRIADTISINHNDFVKVILSNGQELYMTDNHICKTISGSKQAIELTTSDYLPSNGIEYKGFSSINNYSIGYFIGAYLGDGSLNWDGRSNTIMFSLSKPKEKVVRRLIKTANFYGAHSTIYRETDRHVVLVKITSQTLKALIQEFVYGTKSLDKGIRARAYEMSTLFRKGLLKGLYDTDGGNNNRIYTASKCMVDDLSTLYMSLGIAVKIDKDNRPKSVGKYSDNIIYTVRPYTKQSKYSKRPGFLYSHDRYWFQVISVEHIHHNIPHKAYCFRLRSGEPYFTLANGIETGNCRLKLSLTKQDIIETATPWKLRFCALQNVTINLPRIGYEADNDENKVFELLKEKFDLCVKAHIQKKIFIEKLLSLGNKGPLGLLCMDYDGEPYIRMHKATYLIGLIGLNELVKTVTGFELHENNNSLLFGLKVISYLCNLTKEAKDSLDMNYALEQTPAELLSNRLARLDLEHYKDKTSKVVQGCIEENEVYYTNSTYLSTKSAVNFIDRVTKEGMFHPLIKAGSLSHLWLGTARADTKAVANLITKIFRNTTNDQVAISPEFTICNKCNRMERGLKNTCSSCGSDDVDGITRITGYFSKVSGWNKGKLGELRDRRRETI